MGFSWLAVIIDMDKWESEKSEAHGDMAEKLENSFEALQIEPRAI